MNVFELNRPAEGAGIDALQNAAEAGVDVFLVPASQSELADPEQRARLDAVADGQVELVPVDTLDDALEALDREEQLGSRLGFRRLLLHQVQRGP